MKRYQNIHEVFTHCVLNGGNLQEIIHLDCKIIYGYIVVWETIRKLQQTDYMALEMASTTAALERIKTRQLEEACYRMRENFFDDLLLGRIQSVNAVNSLAEIYGMDPRKKYICSVLRIIKIDRDTEEQYPSLEYHIGVSGVCQQFLDISKGYMNAQEALRISNKLSAQGNIFYFSDLMSYHLLDSVLDRKQMEEFYQSILGDLVEFDHKHRTQFIATLYYYFKCGENISAAAKEMYIHRNTFIYRIEKIKMILNNDLKSSEDIFSIQLAMHIMRVLNMRGEL